jgi:chromosome segregation ATPase
MSEEKTTPVTTTVQPSEANLNSTPTPNNSSVRPKRHRRKPKRDTSDKTKDNNKDKGKDKDKEKEQVKDKLREKIREKQLLRTSQVIRNNKLEELYEELDETKNSMKKSTKKSSKNSRRIKAIQAEIQLLENIEQKLQDAQNTDYPIYDD